MMGEGWDVLASALGASSSPVPKTTPAEGFPDRTALEFPNRLWPCKHSNCCVILLSVPALVPFIQLFSLFKHSTGDFRLGGLCFLFVFISYCASCPNNFFSFWRQSPCIPGWSLPHCVVADGPALLILLLLTPEGWHGRHAYTTFWKWHSSGGGTHLNPGSVGIHKAVAFVWAALSPWFLAAVLRKRRI